MPATPEINKARERARMAYEDWKAQAKANGGKMWVSDRKTMEKVIASHILLAQAEQAERDGRGAIIAVSLRASAEEVASG